MLFEAFVIAVLVLANGFFAAAEIAVVALRKSRLQHLVDTGRPAARAVLALRQDPERFLATVQVGITVVAATAAAFGGASIAERLAPHLERLGLGPDAADDVALAAVVAGVSYLTIVFGELVPKSIALRNAETLSLLVAGPIRGLAWLARPAVWLLTASSNLLLRPFGDRTTFTETRLSREELEHLVEEATRAGTVDPRTGELARRALDFGRRVVSEVMVPRSRIDAIPRGASQDEVRRLLLEHGHTRMPVFEDTLDGIVGYISAKDVLALAWEARLVVLEDLLRPAYFVPETMPAARLLQELQRRRLRLAIVVDEHGGVSGLVTTEDLVEELVGELFSEHEVPEELFVREAAGTVRVRGHAPVREVNRALGLDLPEEEGSGTVAGLVIALAGRIPTSGEAVTTADGTRLEVLDASPHLVRLVRLTPPAGPPAAE